MDSEFRAWLVEHRGDAGRQYQLAGITAATIKDYILREMTIAIGESDWETYRTLFTMAHRIENPEVRADVFNHLLVMPGHDLHQEVTMAIQRLESPSSVPYIESVLRGGFGFLAYTSSEDAVIAKWFSHALARIDTPESIALIEEFAVCDNAGIAEEMRYRLDRLAGRE